MELRGTQLEFVNGAVEELLSKSTRKSVWVAPVAYGKSICLAAIIAKLNAPTLILQPNRELLLQNFSKYRNYGYDATICSKSLKTKQRGGKLYTTLENGEEIRCDEISKVTFATAGSIKNSVEDLKKHGIKYILIDECHLSTGTDSVIRNIISGAKIKKVLGVTATPVVLHNGSGGSCIKIISSAFKNLFSNLGHVVQVKEMIDAGYWSKLVYDIKVIDSSTLEYNSSGAEYTLESLKETYDINSTERRCVDAVKELKKEGRKSILIYVPTVQQAIDLAKRIPGSKVVYGELGAEERQKILKDFKELRTSVVINVNILTTGFDHPELDAIVMARPTASIALYYQIIGRITRIHFNKPNGRIVDLSGNVAKFGKVEYLNYEFIDGFGWGLFSNEYLLSNFPINSAHRPTKKNIRDGALFDGYREVEKAGETKLWFGKHTGKQLKQVPQHYLTYILKTFNAESIKTIRQ